jgi:hypothetical protein
MGITYTHSKPTNAHKLLPDGQGVTSAVKFKTITFEGFKKKDGTTDPGTFDLTPTTTAGEYTLSGMHDGYTITGKITINSSISGDLKRVHESDDPDEGHGPVQHTDDTGTFTGTHG